MKKVLALLASLLFSGTALAQQTPFSTFVTTLSPVVSLTGAEKFVGLQSGVLKTATPYQILGAIAGDCTMVSPPSIICTKTNGVSFAASATVNTANASNISSGTLSLSRLALNSALVYVGNVSNVPVGVAISGDCTITNTGAVTCLKTNGSNFVASATTDTTNATNISAGTLANGRYAAVNLAAGNVNGGVTGLLPFVNHPSGSVDTALGYWGTTVLSATAVPNCGGALTYSTGTHTWGCNAGGGNVINSGTPTVGQIGVWVDATHIQGQTLTAMTIVRAVRVQTFASSTTYTPSAGLQYALIECLGAGGAGGGMVNVAAGNGGAGGGGGAGNYVRAYASAASIGGSQAVTIGAGGNSPGAFAGTNGGNTSVGSLCVAGGGGGGGVGPNGAGGGGGTGVTGVLGTGAPGGTGTNQAIITVTTLGPPGGSTLWGGGGAGVICGGTIANGTNATGFGGGGGAGCTQNGAGGAFGGNGGNGLVVITEFTNQ